MFLSFLRARLDVPTKDTFESQLFCFDEQIEFDSISLTQRFFPSYRENHVLLIVNDFYPIGIMQISLSYHRNLELLFRVFGGFASLSWHLACRAASGKIGLATAIVVLGATAGVRYGMICVLQKNSSSRRVHYFL